MPTLHIRHVPRALLHAIRAHARAADVDLESWVITALQAWMTLHATQEDRTHADRQT